MWPETTEFRLHSMERWIVLIYQDKNDVSYYGFFLNWRPENTKCLLYCVMILPDNGTWIEIFINLKDGEFKIPIWMCYNHCSNPWIVGIYLNSFISNYPTAASTVEHGTSRFLNQKWPSLVMYIYITQPWWVNFIERCSLLNPLLLNLQPVIISV